MSTISISPVAILGSNTFVADQRINGKLGLNKAASFTLDTLETSTAESGGTNYHVQHVMNVNPTNSPNGTFATVQGAANYTSAQDAAAGNVLYGVRGQVIITGGKTTVGGVRGLVDYQGTDATTTVTRSLYGGRFEAKITGTGYMNHTHGIKIETPTANNGSVGLMTGLYVAAQGVGTFTNSAAIHIEGNGVNNKISFGDNGSSTVGSVYWSTNTLTFTSTANPFYLTVDTNGRIVVPASSAANPGLQSASALFFGTTGSNAMNLVTNGTARFQMSASAARLIAQAAGTVAAATYSMAAASGTDAAGINHVVSAGQGTGAGAPGSYIIATATTLGTGTTAQTQVARLTISGGAVTTDYATLTPSSTTLIDASGAQSIAIKTVAGTVSDSSFVAAPPNGTIAVDTTNSLIYVRIGGAWKSVAVA